MISSKMSMSSPCSNFLAQLVIVGAVSLSVVGIILYSYDLYRHGGERDLIAFFSSAGFVFLTFVISIRLIVLHLIHWYAPNIQKWLVRIIWMVPIYSIESWLALRFRTKAIYIETIRECYEAYAIFSFLYFLIALLGEEVLLISLLKEKSEDYGLHAWPLNKCIKPWVMGSNFLHHCKFGVLQYVLLKNLMALVIFILQIFNMYGEGLFRFDRGYLYICFISTTSQIWALYCLVKFYLATKDELAPYSPFGKFFCVKVVVFFTWWQAILISSFAYYLDIDTSTTSVGDWSREQKVIGLQDYLICIEMFIAAIAFSISFTHYDYIPRHKEDDEEENLAQGRPFLSALLQSSLPEEIFSDIRRVAKGQDLSEKNVNKSSKRKENEYYGNKEKDSNNNNINSSNNLDYSPGFRDSSINSSVHNDNDRNYEFDRIDEHENENGEKNTEIIEKENLKEKENNNNLKDKFFQT